MIIKPGNRLVVGNFKQRLNRGPMLAGLSDWLPEGMTIDDISDAIVKGQTAINAQRLYDLNLERLAQGKQPIPLQYAAPTVNMGMTPEMTQTLVVGALIIGGIILAVSLSKKR